MSETENDVSKLSDAELKRQFKHWSKQLEGYGDRSRKAGYVVMFGNDFMPPGGYRERKKRSKAYDQKHSIERSDIKTKFVELRDEMVCRGFAIFERRIDKFESLTRYELVSICHGINSILREYGEPLISVKKNMDYLIKILKYYIGVASRESFFHLIKTANDEYQIWKDSDDLENGRKKYCTMIENRVNKWYEGYRQESMPL